MLIISFASKCRLYLRSKLIAFYFIFRFSSFHLLISSVPGPTTPLEICGSRVIKWCALPPQAGKGEQLLHVILGDLSHFAGTLGIGVISYNGGLCVSVAADSVDGTKNVARRLCERFEERFKIYVERAREVVEQH